MKKFAQVAILLAALLGALLVNSEDVSAPCFFDDSDCGGCEVCSAGFFCTSLLCEKELCSGSLLYLGCEVCENHVCGVVADVSQCSGGSWCDDSCGGDPLCNGLQPGDECAEYSFCTSTCGCEYDQCKDPSFFDSDDDGFLDGSCGGTDCDDTVAACTTDCASKKYRDADGDGHGNPSVSARACDAPAGYVSSSDDCDDSDAARYPGNSETACNGKENDCDALIDEDYASVSCGSGSCAGTTICSGGSISCSTWNADCGTCCKCSGGTAASPSSAYDAAQDGDCAATTCPDDGCGVGGCSSIQWGDYPASVANECSAMGSCTSNSCSPTCYSGSDSDGYHPSCGDCNDANANIYPGSCHPDAITWDSTCNESTAGGCGSGTCTRDTDGVVCGSSSLSCSAGSNPYCSGGDVWADTDTDKSCTVYCASGSCGSCTPPGCDTALWSTCSDSCSGQTSPTYFGADTVVDYELCAGGSCGATSLPDSCSGSTLTEWYCSGADAVSAAVDCNSYDHQCTGTCGTAADGCVSHDYSCAGGGNGYCADSVVDVDVSSSWCGDCSAKGTVWAAGGEAVPFGEYDTGTSTECCGDDSNEKYRSTAKGATTYSACCNLATDCVDVGNVCVSDGTQSGGFECVAGVWVDGDVDEDSCTLAGGYWNVGGEVVTTPCCGDDSGENPWYRKCYLGACVDNASDRMCCDAPTDCVFNACFSDVSAAQLLLTEPFDCSSQPSQGACTSGQSKEYCIWSGSKCIMSKAGVQAYGSGNLSAYADVDGDGDAEVCVASSPGQWQGTSGTITGFVRNVTSPVSGALVRVLGTSPLLTATTAGDGGYSVVVPSKTYDLTAAKTGYDASTVYGVFVPDAETVSADFVLTRGLGGCEDDCTAVGGSVCDANCQGKGLCWFDSDATRAACDGTFGLVEMPGGVEYVDCCMGRAYTPIKAQASVPVPAGNVVVTRRPVLYKGRFVSMVIVLFIR